MSTAESSYKSKNIPIKPEDIKTNIFTNEAKDMFLVIKPTKIQTPNLNTITLEKGKVVTIQIEDIEGSVEYKDKEKDKQTKIINNVFYIIFDGKKQLSNLLQNNHVNKDNFLNLDNFKYIGIENNKYYTPGKKSIFGKENTGKICNYPYPDDKYQLRLQLDPNNQNCPDYYAARHHPILDKITKLEPASETIEPPQNYCEQTNNCKVTLRSPRKSMINPIYGHINDVNQIGGKTKKRKTKSRNKRKTKSKTHKKSKKLTKKSKSKKQKNKKTKRK